MKTFNLILTLNLLFWCNIYGQNDFPTAEICDGNTRVVTTIETEKITLSAPPSNLVDTDNDGLDDSLELEGDCDGDGLDNINDPDSDNDGYVDGVDKCVCVAATANYGCPYDKRLIFLAHGFQGNEQSWNLQEDWINEHFNGARPEAIVYTQDQNAMDAAANRMRDIIEDQVAIHQSLSNPNKANFLIAHSMGGVVARNAFEKFNNYDEFPLDGFVTFGSAHEGVGAANTRLNNPEKYAAVISEACEALAIDILQETLGGADGFEIKDYVLLSLEWLNEEAICDELSPLAFASVESSWSQPIEDELTTAESINWPAPQTTHNVAFFGIEPDEEQVVIETYKGETYETIVKGVLTPKFAGGIIEKAGDRPIWEADNLDDVGLEKFAMNLALLEHRKQHLDCQETNANAALITCIFIPPCLGLAIATAIMVSNNQAANDRAFQFMDNINGMWRNIIEADRMEIIETGEVCICVALNGEEVTSELVDGECDIAVAGFECEIVNGQSLISVREDSDGFITQSSAMNMPNATYPPQLMLGSSHFQMRNDKNARDAFDRLLRKDEENPQFHWFNSEE